MSIVYEYSLELNFPKKSVNLSQLADEIIASNVTAAIDKIIPDADKIQIYMKGEENATDRSIIDSIVSNHIPSEDYNNMPINARLIEIPDPVISKVDKTYLERSVNFKVPAGSSYGEGEYVNPYNIVLLGGDFHGNENMKGDHFSVEIHFAENDIVGQLIEPSLAGSKTLVGNWAEGTVWKSYLISVLLTDGQTIYDLGEVTLVDDNTIYFSNELLNDIPIGSYIRMVATPVPYIYINSYPFNAIIGNSTNRGTFIPKGSKLRLRYWSVDTSTEKDVSMIMEYYV